MVRHAIGTMILAASILAVPVLAAQSNDAPNNSPATANHAAIAPSSNMGAGMTAIGPADRTATTADNTADNNSTPRYTTANGQVRVGKMVGASVYNDQRQSIGSIDDVLMNSDKKANTVVLSVGGFLGMGSKLVSVPFDQLKIENDRIVMPGATKASLEGMPEYKYDKNA